MWLLSFYRFYVSIAAGVAAGLFLVRIWWLGFFTAIIVRILWGLVEYLVERARINKSFEAHAYAFKQELGPYGIRMINKAENDASVKRQLAEVFTADETKLRKAVEQLEMMDTLFKAGMRPDGDTYQLHDLKLKYGKFRIEKIGRDKKDKKTG
jgi:hypothetical protein